MRSKRWARHSILFDLGVRINYFYGTSDERALVSIDYAGRHGGGTPCVSQVVFLDDSTEISKVSTDVETNKLLQEALSTSVSPSVLNNFLWSAVQRMYHLGHKAKEPS